MGGAISGYMAYSVGDGNINLIMVITTQCLHMPNQHILNPGYAEFVS